MISRYIGRHRRLNRTLVSGKNFLKWVAKASLFTVTGAVLNGTTSASTGLIGGNIKMTFDHAIKINTLGGVTLGSMIGFAEATPFSTSRIWTLLNSCNDEHECVSECQPFLIPLYIFLEIASGLLGRKILMDDSVTDVDILLHSLVGSIGAFVLIGMVFCLLQIEINKKSLFFHLADRFEELVNYLERDAELIRNFDNAVVPFPFPFPPLAQVIIDIPPPLLIEEVPLGPQLH
jgi:hypothetical protein